MQDSSSSSKEGQAASLLAPPPPPTARVKRLEAPSKESHNAQIASLQAEIDAHSARIVEIKNIVDSKMHNRRVASPEFLQARDRLMELNAAFKAAVSAKRSHREELDLAEKFLEKVRSDSRSLRQRLPFVRVDQIDEEIRKLEYRQTHTTLSIDEERKIVSQISNLQRSRDCIRDHESKCEQDGELRAKVLEMIQEDDKLLNSLRIQQEEQHRILSDIREKEAAQATDIPALLQEKSAEYEKIKALWSEIKHLKVSFQVRLDEYWTRERDWRAKQAQERKLRAEKFHAEKMERESIRKQRELENYVEPYTDEIILCDQMITFVAKLVPVVAEDVHSVPSQQKIAAPEGFGNAIVSKKNRDEQDLDGWFGGFGGKKVKKGKLSSKSKERERIVLPFDVLTSFQKVKISPPLIHGEALKSLDDIKKKKEEFLSMQKAAREKRENGDHGTGTVEVMTDTISSIDDEEVASIDSNLQGLENSPHQTDLQSPIGDLAFENLSLKGSDNDKHLESEAGSVHGSDEELLVEGGADYIESPDNDVITKLPLPAEEHVHMQEVPQMPETGILQAQKKDADGELHVVVAEDEICQGSRSEELLISVNEMHLQLENKALSEVAIAMEDKGAELVVTVAELPQSGQPSESSPEGYQS